MDVRARSATATAAPAVTEALHAETADLARFLGTEIVLA
jgi:hypothetical protein